MLVRMSREFTLSSDVPFRLVSLKSSVVVSSATFYACVCATSIPHDASSFRNASHDDLNIVFSFSVPVQLNKGCSTYMEPR